MSLIAPLVLNDKHTRGPRSGAAAYARAARRYDLATATFAASEGIVRFRSAEDADFHELEAESVQNDLEYVVEVTIGTPGVKFYLDFDTGSSDLWVWSSKLKVDVATLSGHNVYDPTKSSTSKKIEDSTWNIRYGDGSSASGVVYSDVLKLGSLTVQDQGIETATKLHKSFLAPGGSDGLLGLAWPKINTADPQQKTPVQNLIEQGSIQKGVFSVYLKKDAPGPDGFYSFGSIPIQDAGLSESDIFYTPVDNSIGHWIVKSPVTVVNGVKVAGQKSSNTGILDTGTTLALVSDAVVKAIYQAIPGARFDYRSGGWLYPADAKIPDVKIAIGDHLFTVLPEVFGYADATNGYRFGGIQSRGNNPFDILGDIFLKSVFAVFDVQNTRIGVAQRHSDVVGRLAASKVADVARHEEL